MSACLQNAMKKNEKEIKGLTNSSSNSKSNMKRTHSNVVENVAAKHLII